MIMEGIFMGFKQKLTSVHCALSGAQHVQAGIPQNMV